MAVGVQRLDRAGVTETRLHCLNALPVPDEQTCVVVAKRVEAGPGRKPRRSHDVGELNLGQPKVPDYLSRPGGSVAISPLAASWSATSRSLRFRR